MDVTHRPISTTCTTMVAALAALLLPGAGIAQKATLPEFLAEAESRNPAVQAATRTVEAAEARIPGAGALPDPRLGVGVMNLPVSDPSLGREMMTMTTVQLGETFPWPGKLGLREDVARLQATGVRWEMEGTRQDVRAEVKAAYFRVYFLDRAIEVTRRNESLIADLAQLTSARYAVGSGRQPDVLRAQVERTGLRNRIVSLIDERARVQARLNALLARPMETPIPRLELPEEVRVAALEPLDATPGFASVPLDEITIERAGVAGADPVVPGLPTRFELERIALARNPGIQAHVSRVAAQERRVALAGKAALPDFDFSVAYSHRPNFADFVNVMISVPLPVFKGRKQDQDVLEAQASLSEHEARHDSMVDELNAEIASLVSGLRNAREQLVLLDDGILPQSRASLASATASYRVGSVDFLTLLDSQVTLYRHELDYHRLLSEFASDLAALERAVGTEVLR